MQIASLIYLVGALFQGIAYQPVMLMIVGLQIGLYSYVTRLESAKRAAPPDADPMPQSASASHDYRAGGSRGRVTAPS